MSNVRLPILAAGVLVLFASTLSQSGCSDDETENPTTTATSSSTTSSSTTTSTGMGLAGPGGGGSGGTGAGGVGGGGDLNTGTDQCNGWPVSLNVGTGVTLVGDTSTAMDDYDSGCEQVDGPELVYQLNVASAGTLTISVQPAGGYDVSIYMRRFCDNKSSTLFCRDAGSMGSARNWILALDAGTYYLFVDSEGDTGGEYALSLGFTAATCGDGATNAGEQCDDGNLDTGDGCDDECNFEPGSNDSCANPLTVNIIGGDNPPIQGSTVANSDSHGFQDAGCQVVEQSPGGPDRVHALIPQVDGEMRLRLGWGEDNMDPNLCAAGQPGCWGRVLHVRHGSCTMEANQIACAGPLDAMNNPVQDITIPVTALEPYYVFVDSFWAGTVPTEGGGPYWLHVNLTPGSGGAGGAGGGGGAGGN